MSPNIDTVARNFPHSKRSGYSASPKNSAVRNTGITRSTRLRMYLPYASRLSNPTSVKMNPLTMKNTVTNTWVSMIGANSGLSALGQLFQVIGGG
jgi:hypothetical protein